MASWMNKLLQTFNKHFVCTIWNGVSNQTADVDEAASSEEGEVVAGVEAVPDSTHDEHGQSVVESLVDNAPQPQRRHSIPVV